MAEFCERMRYLKESRGYTYSDIAKNLNLQPRMIKNYVSGESNPSYNALIALADMFDVSLDYICGRSEIMKRR